MHAPSLFPHLDHFLSALHFLPPHSHASAAHSYTVDHYSACAHLSAFQTLHLHTPACILTAWCHTTFCLHHHFPFTCTAPDNSLFLTRQIVGLDWIFCCVLLFFGALLFCAINRLFFYVLHCCVHALRTHARTFSPWLVALFSHYWVFFFCISFVDVLYMPRFSFPAIHTGCGTLLFFYCSYHISSFSFIPDFLLAFPTYYITLLWILSFFWMDD